MHRITSYYQRYDLHYYRPAGSSIRSFLTECLAGPLVGLDPKHVHRFCDMYEHARHSYRQFGQLELNNYLNLLDELKSLVVRNTENKPSSPKKSSTPQHSKPLNRPKRRVASTYCTVSYCTIAFACYDLFCLAVSYDGKQQRHHGHPEKLICSAGGCGGWEHG